MLDNVRSNDKKAVHRQIVNSRTDVNAVHGKTAFCMSPAKVLHQESCLECSSSCLTGDDMDKASKSSAMNSASTILEDQNVEECVEGSSLLHLACHTADIGMIEPLLQYGANINAPDSRGQTSFHHCILRGRTVFAKLLITRGADPLAFDREGKTVLQHAAESDLIDDEVLTMLQT